MFIRVKTTPNSPRKSVQIVQSVRHRDKVRQKIVRHIGIAMDEQELIALKELAEVVKSKLEAEHQPSLFPAEQVAKQVIAAKASQSSENNKPLTVNLKHLKEQQRVVMGIHEVYGEMYHQLSFDRLLPYSRYRASNEALFQMVMARIANPDSKQGSVRRLEQDFGVKLSLQSVYRMMDQLDEARIKRLKSQVCQATQALLPGPLSVLFFDCTTLYFESFQEDSLKQNGYSKDCKFNQPQVLIESMRDQYDLDKVVCVADRGMLNEANLKAIEAAGAYYIVGAKLKQLSKAQQAQVLDKSAYTALGQGQKTAREFIDQKRRLIDSHWPKRAAKDQHEREKAVERLIKKLGRSQNPKDLLNNYGYKKFVVVEGKAQLSIDQDKIEQASQ